MEVAHRFQVRRYDQRRGNFPRKLSARRSAHHGSGNLTALNSDGSSNHRCSSTKPLDSELRGNVSAGIWPAEHYGARYWSTTSPISSVSSRLNAP